MIKKILFVLTLLVCSLPSVATLNDGGEYYLWLNIYEKLLGSNATADGPAISAWGTSANADDYVFVAEASGKEGYVLLRQKSSGKYLAASGANSYSMLFESARATDDRYCWQTDEGCYSYLINKKNGKYLGIDGASKGKDYVGVYYDKPRGSHSQWSVVPATGTWDGARQAYASPVYVNAQGHSEIDYCQLADTTIDRSDAVDIHITANDKPLLGSTTVNLGSDSTWLVIDNIVPSEVVKSYLKHVTIDGKAARNNSNCRVAIYLNGAAVIPLPQNIMKCEGTDGPFTLKVGAHNDLGKQSNTMTAFTLRRGYMATLATGTNGGGYSRVFVADHADLTVALPQALDRRVTSVIIKPWQYLSKKGWASTGGATRGPQLRASWFWSWSAGYASTTDMEYVPCRQHRYWPSAADVNSKTATASLSLNEPEHSEQHTSDKCSCGGTISEWTAYTINADFLPAGGRIGSPQPTDFGYLTNFCQHVDNMASRCDFTVTHAYWNQGGRSEADYASWFVSQCKNVWNNTGRPLWITEMEIGSSWGEKFSGSYDDYRKFLQVLLQKMDECDYIERYAIYATDYYKCYMFYDDGGITPAGQVYRDHRATFAYHDKYTKVPTWWVPGVKKPTLGYEIKGDNAVFTIGNDNGDATLSLKLERRKAHDSQWQTVATIDSRADFEKTTLTTSIPLADIDRVSDVFRVSVNTLYNTAETSDELDMNYIRNASITTQSKDNVPGWECERSAANGYTKAASGDTYFEIWNANTTGIAFDYHQQLNGLPAGAYKLQAVVFNSTNGISDATVNGSVGLYARADGLEYFAPVTVDSEIDYQRLTTIDTILVRQGTMRIGVKNQAPMTARWAGADNFVLEYLGTEKEVLGSKARQFLQGVAQRRDQQIAAFFTDTADSLTSDASILIRNADCLRADSYGWTTDNLATNKGQASDGSADNTYWDKWNAGSLKSMMTQTIAYLPAGDYVLSALLRGTSDLPITLTARHRGNTYEATLKGKGDKTVAGDSLQNGWQQLSLPVITAESGDSLTITASVSAESTAWWSADHFTLAYRPSATSGIAETTLRPATSGLLYDLQGRPVNVAVPRRGLYIRDGRKFFGNK